MTMYALLIGCNVGELVGTENDVEAMRRRLVARGFDVEILTGARATYSNIYRSIECLIGKAQHDDVVLIYFAGHGTRVHNPRYQPRPGDTHVEPRLLACLVPTDWHEPGFHGLLDRELSTLLAALGEKTKNVSLILDCCYSARMGKGEPPPEAKVRTLGVTDLDEPARTELAKRLDALDEGDRANVHPSGNIHVIRMVAAEADAQAYELTLCVDDLHQPMGLMTAMLVTVLDDLTNERVTWRSLALMVRERVLARIPMQRPEIEGPSQRYFTELAEAERFGAVPYYRDAGRHALRTSRLLGAELEAEYALMPAGHDKDDEAKRIARARVVGFVQGGALVELDPPSAMPPRGTLAFPLHLRFTRRAIRIRGAGSLVAELRRTLEASRFLVVQAAGAEFEIIVDDTIELRRPSGEVLFCLPNGPAALSAIYETCERWAKAEALRELVEGGLEEPFRLHWGRVADNTRFAMSPGELVHVCDALYVDFINTSQRALFFSVIDIGIDGTICVLQSDTTGRKVEPDERYPFGLEPGQSGFPLFWADAVPRSGALLETILVLVSSGHHELLALENGAPRGEHAPTSLELMLEQIGLGAARGSTDAGHPYTVRRIDILVSPEPRATE